MPGRPTDAHRAAAFVTVLLALGLFTGLAAGPTGSAAAAVVHPTGPFVAIEANGSEELWPYTSRSRSPAGATLPINVVVEHDATFVQYFLAGGSGAQWNVTETGEFVRRDRVDELNASAVEAGVVIEADGIRWTDARGSTRYTYLRDPASGTGRWVDETAQLHDGTYLGARRHVRLYAGGSDHRGWTAIQVHREHWDWFRLRHTVDSVDRAQDRLESEFRGSSIAFSIRRVYYANGGALDSDGWVTTVDRELLHPQQLSLGALLLGAGVLGASVSVGAGRRRLRVVLEDFLADETGPRHLLLLALLPLIVLGVRVGAIAIETAAAALSPKVIAAVFYPILVVGSPLVAVTVSRGLDPDRAAITAGVAFGIGILADYLLIDVATLPIAVLLHRAILVLCLATLAAGGATRGADALADRGWNPLLVVGGVGWLVALVVPLLDLL